MKLVKSNYEILDQDSGLKGIYQQIEVAGRTCYKSTNKITETSAEEFVKRMIESKHYAILEHGTVYLFFPIDVDIDNQKKVEKYERNPYSKCTRQGQHILSKNGYYVTTNYRVLVENNWLDDLKYLCEPTKYHYRRYTVRFTIDRGVSHEFVRHRKFSFAQESTRYCNYNKNRFNNELTYIIPSWITNIEDYDSIYGIPYGKNATVRPHSADKEDMSIYEWLNGMLVAEGTYLNLIRTGLKPEQARAVLPNSLKTELIMTGFVDDWQHFFDLRATGTTGKPHPDAKAVAEPLYKEFKHKGIILR